VAVSQPVFRADARHLLPGFGAYSAMKGAVEVLSRYLAKGLLGSRRYYREYGRPRPPNRDLTFMGRAVRDNQD